MFVDSVKVILEAGSGGDGKMSFRHERYISKGGPDGGDGGDGGDIIFIASNNQNTLADFRHNKLLKAKNGEAGGKRRMHGKRGESLEVALPVGTVISNESGEVVEDLAAVDEQVVAAHGGKGGFGNAHFTSSVRQAPRISERGEPGEKLEVSLELKMIADVGIVGLPNAGKSTLLSVISHARPEIADYPFTTLRPNLGVVDIDGENSLLFADIPGLIEGASQGKGLGDEFLRHTERTKVLIHLIDIYCEDIAAAYKTIINELAAYRADLSKKPQIVALTKTEGFDAKALEQKLSGLKKLVPRGTPVLAISAQAKVGLKELLRATLKKVEQARRREAAKPAPLPVITLSADPEVWQITESEDGFIVTGQKIEKFALRTRFGDTDGEQRLRDILRRMGIARELEKQGAQAGQAVIIGQPEIGRVQY